MLVSILTPSFNQEAWLPDCLRSVERQTYSHIEHIVFDGQSTDGTIDVLKGAPDRVRWWSEPDRGQAHALNKAFSESRGDIIGWINSDDAYYSSDVVARVVHEFERSPHLDVIYGHACLVSGDGLVLQMIWTPRFNRALLRRFNFIVQPAAFIRRQALRETFVDET